MEADSNSDKTWQSVDVEKAATLYSDEWLLIKVTEFDQDQIPQKGFSSHIAPTGAGSMRYLPNNHLAQRNLAILLPPTTSFAAGDERVPARSSIRLLRN